MAARCLVRARACRRVSAGLVLLAAYGTCSTAQLPLRCATYTQAQLGQPTPAEQSLLRACLARNVLQRIATECKWREGALSHLGIITLRSPPPPPAVNQLLRQLQADPTSLVRHLGPAVQYDGYLTSTGKRCLLAPSPTGHRLADPSLESFLVELFRAIAQQREPHVQLSPFCLFHAHMFLAPPHPDELNDNLDHNHYNHNGHNVKQHSAALHTLHRFSHHAHSDRGHGPGPAPDPTQIGTCLLTNGQGNAYPVTGDSGNCRGNDNADAHNNIDGRHGPGFTGSGEGRRGGAHDGGGGGSGRHVGLLFHACEYPAFHPERFPYPLGHCQADSDLQHSGQAMAQRNVLWYQDRLVVLDVSPGSPLRSLLWEETAELCTLYESDLGAPLADLTLLLSPRGTAEAAGAAAGAAVEEAGAGADPVLLVHPQPAARVG